MASPPEDGNPEKCERDGCQAPWTRVDKVVSNGMVFLVHVCQACQEEYRPPAEPPASAQEPDKCGLRGAVMPGNPEDNLLPPGWKRLDSAEKMPSGAPRSIAYLCPACAASPSG